MPKEFLDKELKEVNGGSCSDGQRYNVGTTFTTRGINGMHCKVIEYLGDGNYMLEMTKDGTTYTQKVTEMVITELLMGIIR